MARQLSKKLMSYVLQEIKSHGFVKIDSGEIAIVTRKLNPENFKMTEGFEKQMTEEHLIDTFVTFLSFKTNGQFSQDELPIFGDANRYVTKWLGATSIEESIETFIHGTNSSIVKRINQFKELKEAE